MRRSSGREATITDVEGLLGALDVRLSAFAMCEIEDGCSLDCPPMPSVVIHYVLRGEGCIECEHGRIALRPGVMVVVPSHLAKRINGSGPVARTVAADDGCPLVEGMVRFRACRTGRADLILGCGAIDARVGDGAGLFDHLREPLVEEAQDSRLALLFTGILDELSHPAVGTKAMVEALMKQILVLLLRAHVKRRGPASPLYMPLMSPQLGRALAAIVDRPQDRHSVGSLAAVAGMSRTRFAHHFGAAYGRAPMAFVQAVRLKAAARMLQGSKLPVKAVAAAVGFASRSHFSRAFAAEFGIDPSAFRRSGGSPIRPLGDEPPGLDRAQSGR